MRRICFVRILKLEVTAIRDCCVLEFYSLSPSDLFLHGLCVYISICQKVYKFFLEVVIKTNKLYILLLTCSLLVPLVTDLSLLVSLVPCFSNVVVQKLSVRP